jgi:hypothetical protein
MSVCARVTDLKGRLTGVATFTKSLTAGGIKELGNAVQSRDGLGSLFMVSLGCRRSFTFNTDRITREDYGATYLPLGCLIEHTQRIAVAITLLKLLVVTLVLVAIATMRCCVPAAGSLTRAWCSYGHGIRPSMERGKGEKALVAVGA